MADIRIIEAEEPKGKRDKTPLKFSKKNKKKKLSRGKKILIIVGILLLFLGYFGYRAYGSLSEVFESSGLNLPGLLGEVNQLKGEKDGRVNVLFLGIGDQGHAGQNLSDTIMIVSLDTKSKKVAFVSVPRDMYINIPGYGYSRINEAHANGENKKKGTGPEKAKETIAQTFDIPVHYYVRVDFSGLEKIVDAVGGIDVVVEKDIYDPEYPDDGPYSIDAGKQHLNGKEALKYSRSRKSTSDFDRAKRQQQVIMAVKEKALSGETLFNPKKVLDVMSALGDHMKTDFQLAEIKRTYELTKDVDNGQIIRKVIDNGESGLLTSANIGGASVLQPTGGSLKKLREFVQNVFNNGTATEDKSISIIIVNSSGVAGEAMKESEALAEAGYSNVQVEAGGTVLKTAIYDYTGGASKITTDYLTSKYKVTPIKQSKTGSVDIKIVLGSDFKG